MNRYLIYVMFIFIVSSGFSQNSNTDWPNLNKYKNSNIEVLSRPKTNKRIVLMGNSITEGWTNFYPEYFKNKDIINRGISGQTTPQMLIRFKPDVIDLNPDIVVILAGINDIAENTGPSSIKMITDNITSMAKLAKSHNINVILSSILPAYDFPWRTKIKPHYKILKINETLQEYAIKNGHVYLDYFSTLHDGNNGLIKKYGIDPVHPNKDGYIVMSKLLDQAIEESLTNKISSNVIDRFKQKVFKKRNNESLNYRLAEPMNIKRKEKYPMLVFLHGADGRGNDNIQQLYDANAIGAFSKQNIIDEFQSFIFVPQVPQNERWVNTNWNTSNYKRGKISNSMQLTFEALDSILKKNRSIDKKRIYIMGLSMGGWGTWDAIQRRPNFFAAAVPICGGGDVSYVKDISFMPIWAWHGKDDSVINIERSSEMVLALNEMSNQTKFTEVENRGHDSWIDVWNNKEVWKWLYRQKKN